MVILRQQKVPPPCRAFFLFLLFDALFFFFTPTDFISSSAPQPFFFFCDTCSICTCSWKLGKISMLIARRILGRTYHIPCSCRYSALIARRWHAKHASNLKCPIRQITCVVLGCWACVTLDLQRFREEQVCGLIEIPNQSNSVKLISSNSFLRFILLIILSRTRQAKRRTGV